MIGVHFCDVVSMDEHLAAGLDDVPWAMVAKRPPDGLLRTCEFQNTNSQVQVTAGLRRALEVDGQRSEVIRGA